MISSWLKKNFLDLLFVGLIVGASIFAWHGVLGQMIEGEGFYYFSPGNSLINLQGTINNPFTAPDNFPRILYFVLERTVGGNMDGYMWFLFLTIILVNIAFYFSIKGITGNRMIALFATVMAGIRFSSNFQFYGRGHFQWFTQRVPELFPILLSFYLIIKFINTRKFNFYLGGLAFFLLALLLSQYTTLFLPFYVGVFISSALFKKERMKERLKELLFFLPFVLINMYFVSISTLGLSIIKPGQSLVGSIFSNQHVFQQIIFQLTTVTVPYSIFKPLIENLAAKPELVIEKLAIPVIIFYFLSFWILYKKNKKDFWIYFGIFLATLGNFFLNIYVNRVKPYNEVIQGRYYFIPSFFVGILLPTFIYYYLGSIKFFRKKALLTAIFILLVIVWTKLNTELIQKAMKDSQYQYTSGRLLLAKLAEEKTKTPEGSYVMLPNPLMPLGEDFLEKFYSNGTTKFLFIDTKWKQRLPGNMDPDKLFVYDYSKPSSMIVDRSQEYRDQLSP